MVKAIARGTARRITKVIVKAMARGTVKAIAKVMAKGTAKEMAKGMAISKLSLLRTTMYLMAFPVLIKV